ncbi:Crp/Fnr family transcriptional regulator [Methylobacterium sp. ARG-1]|uniref:Crp/Fnr family transcriptional regulator n=1 Tax=Methylobacterium sp. ARG-1 TaxID=1692501 RepID=UPI0006806A8C|nr:Crp/Fnr family transcriptional regulator [Methylobacterium sp. ARG-1]KNY20028.1 CarD family transcriptional regulator [Methylobacterium sp. ARG-1]
MPQPHQSTVRNRLLKALSPDDFALLQPHLELIPTELRQPLIKPHEPIQQLYFPEIGFGSITSLSAGSGRTNHVEVGLIGREGVVGIMPALLSVDRTPHDHFVQAAGEMLRIETSALTAAVRRSPSLNKLLQRSIYVQFVQTAQTAFANASYELDTRLARWLLMCHDRLDGDEIRLTHEFLSIMLGVTRSSATLAVQALEGHQLIKARRGQITILNREALIEVADGSYGLPEAEFARLIEAA